MVDVYLKKIVGILTILVLIIAFQGCISIAGFSDLPESSTEIDFDKYSREIEDDEPFWTWKTSFEFYFEKKFIVGEETMLMCITKALKEDAYRIHKASKKNDYVFGNRGLNLIEWNTKTGVYYKIDTINKKTQIYVKSFITQDILGGFGNNRSKKIAYDINRIIDKERINKK